MRYSEPANTTLLKIHENDVQPIVINYYLTKDLCMTDGAPQTDVYGIEAQISVEGIITDSSAVKDISPSLSKVQELINQLAMYQVTPITLKDVIEDYIAEN